MTVPRSELEHLLGVPPLPERAGGRPLGEFLTRVRPKIKRLLARYHIPELAAEQVLRETLQVLVWKWETVKNREAWLLAVLERKCILLVGGVSDET